MQAASKSKKQNKDVLFTFNLYYYQKWYRIDSLLHIHMQGGARGRELHYL